MTTERGISTSNASPGPSRRPLLERAARKLLPARLVEPAHRGWKRLRQFASSRALFHEGYYREMNRDLTIWPVRPDWHFELRGWREGRSPHPIFDVPFYLRQNPDVAARRVNPVRHFLARGWIEGRNPNRLFDGEFYLRTYPDIAAAGMNPLLHYLLYGAREGRDPGPLFDTKGYQELYPDQDRGGLDPLSYYLWRGAALGHALPAPRQATIPLVGRDFRRLRGATWRRRGEGIHGRIAQKEIGFKHDAIGNTFVSR
jgi:hypothetical protein